MKKIYQLFGASLLALGLSANLQAAEKKTPTKPVAQQPAQKAQNTKAQSLDDALVIKLLGREMMVDNQGQASVVFKFNISNMGSQPMTKIQWLGVYVNDRKVIYSQDMQINLEVPLQQNQAFNINLQIPFQQIEERFRPIFMNNQAEIRVFPVDRKVFLTNKQTLSD